MCLLHSNLTPTTNNTIQFFFVRGQIEFLFLTRASGACHIRQRSLLNKIIISLYLNDHFADFLTLCISSSTPLSGLMILSQVSCTFSKCSITELHPHYLSSFDAFLEGLEEVRLSSPKMKVMDTLYII